jgi:predicted acetyltransferase
MTSEPVVRGATEQDFEEIVRMTATAFGDPSSDWPREHTEHDPNHTADLHRICVVDGRIVSAMLIAWHTVHYGSALLKHAGVGDVGTLPDERHHGYSTMVLKDAIAHMQRLGAHFSILYTGIQPFYERLGWAILPIEVPRFAFRQREAAASDARAWVEDFDADRHLEGVRAVYNEFNARKTATTVRESAYWDLRFRRQPRPPLHSVRPDVLVAGQSDAVGAYAIWHARAGVAEVHEYGWRKGCEEPLRTLFAETGAGASRGPNSSAASSARTTTGGRSRAMWGRGPPRSSGST